MQQPNHGFQMFEPLKICFDLTDWDKVKGNGALGSCAQSIAHCRFLSFTHEHRQDFSNGAPGFGTQ
jgi:hypothetical protein